MRGQPSSEYDECESQGALYGHAEFHGQTGQAYREEAARSGRAPGTGDADPRPSTAGNLTELARERRLEPCVGRDQEIPPSDSDLKPPDQE